MRGIRSRLNRHQPSSRSMAPIVGPISPLSTPGTSQEAHPPTPPLAPFLLTGNNLEGETTLVLDGWLKCVVEGGSVVWDFRDVVSRKVSDLLSGKDLGNDGTALLSGLEALSALEASALPEKYKRQPPQPKKKVARKR